MIIDLREIPVVWINLDRAKDNAEKMEEQFKKYGFKNHRRFSAVTPDILKNEWNFDDGNYVHACGMSHFLILNEIIDKGPVLILEDDAKITDNFNPIIEVDDRVDGIYVGISTGNRNYRTKSFDQNFLRVANMLSTHAILYISENYKKTIKDVVCHYIFNLRYPFDVGISSVQDRFTILAPTNPYFIQSDERNSEHKWEFFTLGPLENRNSDIHDHF